MDLVWQNLELRYLIDVLIGVEQVAARSVTTRLLLRPPPHQEKAYHK